MLIFAALFALSGFRAGAQTTLTAGDIAFTRYNASGDGFSGAYNEFTFIVLRTNGISANTVINFTDNGWNTALTPAALSTNEGVITWVAPTGGVAQFTQVTLKTNYSSGTSLQTISLGTATLSGAFVLSGGGDQIFAYQGNIASPSFIAGIHMNSEQFSNGMAASTRDSWDKIGTGGWTYSASRSGIPPSLTEGSTAVFVVDDPGLTGGAEFDNAVYDCTGATGAATVASIKASINNYAYWTKQNTPTALALPSCTFSIGSPAPTITPGAIAGICKGTTTASLSYTATGSPDKYTIDWDATANTAGLADVADAVLPANTISIAVPSGIAAGSYTGSVSVKTGTTAGAAQTITLVVNALPSTPSPSSNSPVCTGNTINLSTPAVAGATYSWTGPNSFTSSVQNPTITNATTAMAGTYSVTVTTNGCTSIAGTTPVVVNTKPATPAASSNSPVCTGNTINLSTPAVAGATYIWTGPNSFTSAVQNPTITNATTAMAGTYSVTVTTNGCTSIAGTTPVVVNTKPATPTASSNSPVCTGNTINLSTPAVAGATYSWTGPNSFTSAVQNPTITNATTAMAGTYSVTVTTNGCTSIAGTTPVVVNTKPATPTPSSNSPVCTGNTINLSTAAVAGATYSWTGPNSFTSAVQNPTIINATTAMAGTYSVTVTTNGCSSIAGTTNIVVSLPTIAPGTIASVSTTATSFSLPYTATGSPTTYTITSGTRAMAGFSSTANSLLGTSPVTIGLPGSKTAGTYDFNISVKNSSGCVSTVVPFTLTVAAASAAPTVTTNPVTTFNATTATLGGNVTSDGGSAVTERGIVWSTTTSPTVNNNKVIVTGTTGNFSKSYVGPFAPNTTIYVKAYAINSKGTSYGAEVSFKTSGLAGTGAIFDFEPGSGDYSGWNTKTLTASNASASSSLSITSVSDLIYKDSDWGLFDQQSRFGTEGLNFGKENGESSVTLEMTGRTFDLSSLYLSNQTTNATTFTISTSKGSISIPYAEQTSTLPIDYVDVAGSTNSSYFKGISSFTITAEASSGPAFFGLDHFVTENIVTSVTGPTISFNGCAYDAEVLTRDEANDVGGRYAFKSQNIAVKWNSTGAKWEILSSDNTVLYSSAIATSPKPPALSIGKWTTDRDLGCPDLTDFTGDGTETTPVVTAPIATTNAVSTKSSTTATLSGIVSDGGAEASVSFEYSTSSTLATFTSVAATPNTVAATAGSTNVSAALSGLTASTTYYYRVKALNSAGTTAGDIKSFTTDAPAGTTVSSIVRKSTINPTNATTVEYTVTFAGSVTGVDAADFSLTKTGTANGVIGTPTGSGTTWTVPVNIVSGDGTLRLDFTSLTGVTPSVSAAYTGGQTYTIDNIKPSAPVATTPADGSYTNNTRPVYTGTAEPSGSVTVIVDGTSVGTTTANASGNWALTQPTALASGPHTISATASDEAGNTSANSNTNTFIIDVTAPSAPVATAPANGSYTNNTKPAYSGTSEPSTTVTVIVDGTSVGTKNADASGNWTLTQPAALAAGAHTISATASDLAGNTSPASNTNTFIIDVIAPSAPVVTVPANGSVSGSASPSYSGTAEPGETLTVFVDGSPVGSLKADASGNWSVTQPTALAGGSHTVYATATDAAGNTSLNSNTNTFTIDTTSPVVASVTVPSTSTYKLGTELDYTVKFSEAVNVNTIGGTPSIALTLNSATVNASYVSGNGTSSLIFRYTVSSGDADPDGVAIASAITLNGGTIKDAAGNETFLTLKNIGSSVVKVDGVVPTLSTVTIASDNATNTLAKEADVITLNITSSEEIGTPTVTIAGQTASVTGSGSNYTATYTTTSTTTEGAAAINIAFNDLAGNAGTAVKATTNSSTVRVDRTAPAIPAGFMPTAGDTKITLNWNANAESDIKSYKIYAGTSINPTYLAATIDAPTVTKLESSLTNGTTYYYRITATDQAGNESNYSATVSATPKASQTITFNALANKTYGDASFDLEATASSALAVSYESSNTAIASVSDNTVTIHKAGTVSITAKQAGNSAYLAASDVTRTLTIDPKALTITANKATKTYGEILTEVTGSTAFTSVGLVGSETVGSVTLAYGTGSAATASVDTYTEQVTPGAATGGTFTAANYSITYAKGDLVVKPAALTITANKATKTYGEELSQATGSTAFTQTGLKNGESIGSVTITYGTGSAATAAADTYTEQVTPGAATGGTFAAANYNITYAKGDLVVNKKAIAVTAKAKDKTYGEADPALDYDITTGVLVGTDAFSGSLKREVGENVGAYAINQGTLELSANYDLSYAGAKLTIAKKAIAITAKAKDKTYGEADPALDYDITTGALVGNDSFSGSLTRETGENVGEYAINQGTLELSANYDLSYNKAKLTIGKKAITVTAKAKDKTYGDADPALDYDITTGALVGNDAFSGSLTRDAGENVGEYDINQGTLALSTNYDLSYNKAKLTIGKKAIAITAKAKNKTYGETDPALDYDITAGALVGNDAFRGSLSREAGENVGEYAINQGTLELSANYDLSYNKAKLTIAKKAITVTAKAQDKTYGETDPALNYDITTGALVGNDAFSGSLSRETGENVGEYAINQGTLELSANYDLSYNKAKLTIGKKAITVTAKAEDKTYGETDPALDYDITTGTLVGNDTFSGALTRDAGEDVGEYKITQGSLALSDNYTLSYTAAKLSIGKKAITVTAVAKDKTYGEADPALTYHITTGTLVGSDAFSGSLKREAGENVGEYTINQGTLALSANYTLSYNPAKLTIGKKVITVTAQAKNKIYGETDPALAYDITTGTLVGSDYFSGSLSREAGENVGDYAINQGTLALSGNYDLSYTGAKLTIGKKAVTVTAAAKNKTYGEADPALTYSITTGALVGSDAFSGSLTRQAGENAGSYEIKQGTLALNNNYTLSYNGANLTIAQKTLTVTVNNQSKTYGAVNPALTVTYSGLVNGETALNPAPAVTTTATTQSGVGSYDITASGTAANYTVSFVKGTLTVNKAALTITAENKEKFQGLALPAFTAAYAGFVNGETSAVLSTLPSFSTTATANSAQGTYPITVSAATAANYAITFVPGTLTVKPGYPTSITLAATTLFENAPAGTAAGTLSSTSDDPSATFTYTLVSGTGSTDNTSFNISGNQLQTNAVLNFESKASYSVLVRSTTQYGLSLDKQFTITLNNVNEQPRLNDIAAQTICYTPAQQTVALSGITAGEDAGQSTQVTISTSNNALFEDLQVSQAGSDGKAQIRYTLAKGVSGSAVINLMVMDNGGTDNGGVNTILKSFVLNVNPLPVIAINSDKGTSLSKGEVAVLKADVSVANNGLTYQWSNANGILSGQNSQNLTVRPTETTTYTVTVTNANQCSSTETITIEVRADFQVVDGTNIVTPNGDGVNDNFVIRNIDMYPNNVVKIFDRAGRLLYSKINYGNEWTGTFNGSPLAEDTYYYIVDFGAGKQKIKGFITIVRD